VSRAIPLSTLFVAGLAAGVWIFVSPWVLGYPATAGWTSSTWTSVWVGGILTAASAVSLVAVLAEAMHSALHGAPGRR
jgi:fatty acid desaturase